MNNRNQNTVDDPFLQGLIQKINAGEVPSINSVDIAALSDADLHKCIQTLLMLKNVESSFLDNVLELFWAYLDKERVKNIKWQHEDIAALMRLANFKYCHRFVRSLMMSFYRRIKKSNKAIINVFGAIDLDQREGIYFRCIVEHPHSTVEAILTFLSLMPVETHRTFLFRHIRDSRKSFRAEDMLMKWLERNDVSLNDACSTIMAKYIAQVSPTNRVQLMMRIDSKVNGEKDTKKIADFYYEVLSRMKDNYKPHFVLTCLYTLMGSVNNLTDVALTDWWEKAADKLVVATINNTLMVQLVQFANNMRYPCFLSSFVKTYFRYLLGSELLGRMFLVIDSANRETVLNYCVEGSGLPCDKIELVKAMLKTLADPIVDLTERKYFNFLVVRSQLLREIDGYLNYQQNDKRVILLRVKICETKNAENLIDLIRTCRECTEKPSPINHYTPQNVGLFSRPSYSSLTERCEHIVMPLKIDALSLEKPNI